MPGAIIAPRDWPAGRRANWLLTAFVLGEKWLGKEAALNIPLDRDKPIALPRQIQAHLERLIRTGFLAPGTMLPATRELARALGVDGEAVMAIVRRDTTLNISPAYLTPGFAFGGSCLPKDLRALAYAARGADLTLPLIESILPSNAAHLGRALDLVLAERRRPVAVLGLAFKPGTDDLRESPQLALVEQLIGKGWPVRIYDRAVSLARLVGANRAFLESAIPHVADLLAPSIDRALEGVDLVIAASHDPEAVAALAGLPAGTVVIDLAGALPEPADGVTVRRPV